MTAKGIALERKRAALIAQITVERALLAQQGAALRPAALMIDRVNAGVNFVKSHPVILLLPITILTLRRPRQLLVSVVKGIGVWRLLQFGRHRLR